ncbi:hypothetical protein BRADI_1g56446v3 [Brachypodium distachyon]|uniref:Uncharacterized protein n=1 Tax=Brachypodium distachyon TaxID=15368 RepID=A0A2K2DRS5_BRADI|nr:hypothetical protein BRADI_1g56446v3 [Brachypodium distachyon]
MTRVHGGCWTGQERERDAARPEGSSLDPSTTLATAGEINNAPGERRGDGSVETAVEVGPDRGWRRRRSARPRPRQTSQAAAGLPIHAPGEISRASVAAEAEGGGQVEVPPLELLDEAVDEAQVAEGTCGRHWSCSVKLLLH